MNYAIEMNDISKMFGDKHALKQVSFTVNEQEIFGLLGPSGAGKTTAIKILTGQTLQSGGEAKIFGKSTTKLGDETYSKIGIVTDNSGVYERMSCYDNLLLFAKIFNLGKQRVLEVLEQVNLQNDLKTEVRKLSRGMKQRLVLARAALHKPKLIFLDEPTSSLDPSTAKEIHNLLLDMNKNGATFFITTHNMDEATKLCGRIALLNNGVVAELGTPEELCFKHNTEPKIRVKFKNGKNVELQVDAKNLVTISDWLKNGEVLSIHSSEPNLEEVFLMVTGRELV